MTPTTSERACRLCGDGFPASGLVDGVCDECDLEQAELTADDPGETP